jgi:bifunctional non-homologous end joining protein LigD
MTYLIPEALHTVMEPIPYPEAFDHPDYLYQVKWDGVRIMAHVQGGNVQLINKHMNERTEQYLELQALPRLLNVNNAVLDGEVVVIKESKASFPDVMRRDRCSDYKNIKYLQQKFPVDYMVFDLLWLNGKNLMHEPLSIRKSYLQEVLHEKDFIHLLEDFYEGKTLFEAVKSMHMEGVVAKKKDGSYIEGKKHQDWLKIKCRQLQNCLLGGYTLRGKIVNSLLLGVYDENDFLYVGKAASGLTTSQQEVLAQELPKLQINYSPFGNLPGKRGNFHFLKPELGVKVEFQEWTEDLKLRTPVIKAFADIEAGECRII